jgi:hypothetical protein
MLSIVAQFSPQALATPYVVSCILALMLDADQGGLMIILFVSVRATFFMDQSERE